MKFEIELDEAQIEILMGHCEGWFFSRPKLPRGADLMDEEIRVSESWDSDINDRWDAMKLMPVYAQLLSRWLAAGGDTYQGVTPCPGVLEYAKAIESAKRAAKEFRDLHEPDPVAALAVA